MHGSQLLLFCLTLALSSCADANYGTPPNTNDGSDHKLESCLATFTSGHCVSYEWEKLPTDEEFGSFVFRTFSLDPDDETPILEELTGTMAVVLWMPSMGHGSSPVTVQRLDVGVYRATRVFFTMKGDWDIHFQLKDGAKVLDEAIVPISL